MSGSGEVPVFNVHLIYHSFISNDTELFPPAIMGFENCARYLPKFQLIFHTSWTGCKLGGKCKLWWWGRVRIVQNCAPHVQPMFSWRSSEGHLPYHEWQEISRRPDLHQVVLLAGAQLWPLLDFFSSSHGGGHCGQSKSSDDGFDHLAGVSTSRQVEDEVRRRSCVYHRVQLRTDLRSY